MNNFYEPNQTSNASVLGILCLDEKFSKDITPIGINVPSKFDYNIIYHTVKGATLERVLDADPELDVHFITAAKELEQHSPNAIISNCGYSISYQRPVQESILVPVALSSLQLLPMLHNLLSKMGRIGILTFDSNKLTEKHLKLAYPPYNSERCLVKGIEGSVAWQKILQEANYDLAQMELDITNAVSQLGKNEHMEIFLLECAAFTDFTHLIRTRFRLPVFDFVSLADLLIRNVPK